jgi:hypothetical protein
MEGGSLAIQCCLRDGPHFHQGVADSFAPLTLEHQQNGHVLPGQISQIDGGLTECLLRIGLGFQNCKDLADREHSLFDRQSSKGDLAAEVSLDRSHELGFGD